MTHTVTHDEDSTNKTRAGVMTVRDNVDDAAIATVNEKVRDRMTLF